MSANNGNADPKAAEIAVPGQDLDLHNDHNAYLLGAGYSADAGLPLMWNFLQVMRDAMEALNTPKYQREVEVMRYVFKLRRDAAAAGYRSRLNVENIEELFSLASALEGPEAEKKIRLAIAGTITHAIAARREGPRRPISMKNATKEAMGRIPSGWALDATRQQQGITYWTVPEYQFRAAMMCGALGKPSPTKKTSIVTFNYDTLVEDALTELCIPYDLPGPVSLRDSLPKSIFTDRAGEVSLYKLHGSVSWAVTAPTADPTGVQSFGGYEQLNEAGLVPVIQPPTWRKDYGDLFSKVWNGAVQALSTVTQLTVIGFSMPETDLYVRYLLAAGLARNISLRHIVFVNNTSELQQFVERVLKCFREELVERGELGFCSKSAETFFHQLSLGRVDIGDDRHGLSVNLGRDLVGSDIQWSS